MSLPARLQRFLDDQSIQYRVLEHPETFTTMEMAQALHVPGKEMAKVVITRADGNFLMAVLPACYKVDLGALADATGAEDVDLANEGEIRGLFPDCEVGAMPPFGNLYGLPTYVDRHLSEDSEIVFEGGNHHEAIRVTYSDYERAAHPIVVNVSKGP